MINISLAEYVEIDKKIAFTANCITEYMKMFYAAGVAVVVTIWYVLGKPDGISVVSESSSRATASQGNLLDHGALGFAITFISMLVLAFASVIFHKLNTHNRYSGYARAIEFESATIDHEQKNDDREGHEPEIAYQYFWERCLHRSTLPVVPADPSLTDRARAIRESVVRFVQARDPFADSQDDGTREAPKSQVARFFVRAAIGMWMIMRTPVSRYWTRSWTYPYPIAFGLFSTGFFLIMAWCVWAIDIPKPRPGAVALGVQIIINVYAIICWLGMASRLYRLCHNEFGDRTIEFYMYSFLLRRECELQKDGVVCDWHLVPSAPSQRIKPLLPRRIIRFITSKIRNLGT